MVGIASLAPICLGFIQPRRRYYVFNFIKLPIYDFFGLINYVSCNYLFGISLVLISFYIIPYDGGDSGLAFKLK